MKDLILRLIASLQQKININLLNQPTDDGQRLFKYAQGFLGKDASPLDKVPDEYGCAESVSTIVNKLFGDFPIITGTFSLYTNLQSHPKFLQVSKPLPGDIILSPTGLGNGVLIGHTGIIGADADIMSNNSTTGLWDIHYTLDSWRQRYQMSGGMPIYLFRRVN